MDSVKICFDLVDISRPMHTDIKYKYLLPQLAIKAILVSNFYNLINIVSLASPRHGARVDCPLPGPL